MFDGNLLIPDWNPTDIRFASAGGGAVRGAVAVCLRRRGQEFRNRICLKLLRNQKFLILGQNLPVFCYGLGDARSGRA